MKNTFMKSDLEIIKRYEKTRRSGCFNMITEAYEAAQASGLTKDEYFYAIDNYSKLIELLDDSEDYGF